MSNELGFPATDDTEYYFLSYDHEDTEQVSAIAQKLVESGIKIWYDSGLMPGDEIRSVLAEKIMNAKAVIVFITATVWTKKNSFVQQEYDVAKDIYKKRTIIVLLHQIDTGSIPPHKAFWAIEIKYMKFIKGFGEKSTQELVDEILRAIELPGYHSIEKSKGKYKTNKFIILD